MNRTARDYAKALSHRRGLIRRRFARRSYFWPSLLILRYFYALEHCDSKCAVLVFKDGFLREAGLGRRPHAPHSPSSHPCPWSTLLTFGFSRTTDVHGRDELA